jgi:hypothetical protein
MICSHPGPDRSAASTHADGLTGLLHRGPQRWQVVCHDLPDAFEVEVEVGVRGEIAEAVDLPPWDTWLPILELRAELGRRIREDLEPPRDRVLDLLLLEEGCTPAADVFVDELDDLVDVWR